MGINIDLPPERVAASIPAYRTEPGAGSGKRFDSAVPRRPSPRVMVGRFVSSETLFHVRQEDPMAGGGLHRGRLPA